MIWRRPANMTDEQWARRVAEIENGPVDRSWSVRWGVLAFILGTAIFSVVAAPYGKAFVGQFTDPIVAALFRQ